MFLSWYNGLRIEVKKPRNEKNTKDTHTASEYYLVQ